MEEIKDIKREMKYLEKDLNAEIKTLKNTRRQFKKIFKIFIIWNRIRNYYLSNKKKITNN